MDGSLAANKTKNEQENPFFKKFQSKMISTGTRKQNYSLAWSCDGQYLSTADNNIKIWQYDSSSSQSVMELKGHSEIIWNLNWHPTDPNVLASISKDASIQIWDIRNKGNHAVHSDKTQFELFNMAWNPTGQMIACGNKENQIIVYDTRMLTKLSTLPFNNSIQEFAWDLSNSVFFVSATSKNGSGSIFMLDGKNPQLPELTSIQCHQSAISCLAVDPMQRYLATAAAESLVCIWDIYEMICLQTFSTIQGVYKKLSFSFDGQYIATASESNFIEFFNVEQKNHYNQECTNGVQVLKWHPQQYLLAYIEDEQQEGSDIGIHFYGPDVVR